MKNFDEKKDVILKKSPTSIAMRIFREDENFENQVMKECENFYSKFGEYPNAIVANPNTFSNLFEIIALIIIFFIMRLWNKNQEKKSSWAAFHHTVLADNVIYGRHYRREIQPRLQPSPEDDCSGKRLLVRSCIPYVSALLSPTQRIH